jgi:hypothetical protein
LVLPASKAQLGRGQLAQRGPIHRRERARCDTGGGVVQRLDECAHHIVDVGEFQLGVRIPDLDGQTTRNVVAERGHHRVVVRSAPFAEDARQAKDHRGIAGGCAQGFDGSLGVALAAAVSVVLRRLGGRRQDERNVATAGSDRVAERLGEPVLTAAKACSSAGRFSPAR